MSAKVAKAVLDLLHSGYSELLRSLHIIDYPVPPLRLLRSTSGASITHYFHSGMNCYLPLVTCAKALGVQFGEGIHVLDFGCGVGRQLLHFTRRLPNSNYFACDVNPDCLAFLRRAYPEVDVQVNEYSPPLMYDSGVFDFIYSVSVFSHLPPEHHEVWLEELARVAKKGAVILLTIEGKTALRIMGSRVWGAPDLELERLLFDRGVLYREYSDLAAQRAHPGWLRRETKYIGIQGSYGSTVMTPDYVADHWASAALEVVRVIEGVVDNRQDIVVLRRR